MPLQAGEEPHQELWLKFFPHLAQPICGSHIRRGSLILGFVLRRALRPYVRISWLCVVQALGVTTPSFTSGLRPSWLWQASPAAQTVMQCVCWTLEAITPWSKMNFCRNPLFSLISSEESSVELQISIGSSPPSSGHLNGCSFYFDGERMGWR